MSLKLRHSLLEHFLNHATCIKKAKHQRKLCLCWKNVSYGAHPWKCFQLMRKGLTQVFKKSRSWFEVLRQCFRERFVSFFSYILESFAKMGKGKWKMSLLDFEGAVKRPMFGELLMQLLNNHYILVDWDLILTLSWVGTNFWSWILWQSLIRGQGVELPWTRPRKNLHTFDLLQIRCLIFRVWLWEDKQDHLMTCFTRYNTWPTNINLKFRFNGYRFVTLMIRRFLLGNKNEKKTIRHSVKRALFKKRCMI